MSSVENVTAAKPKIGGSVHVVALGTALPEDAVSELSTEFNSLGYISEDGVLKRIVIPRGSLVEVSEITYKDSEPIGYEIKIAALPDSKGFTHYEYIKKKGA